jgi:hypothetical protein
VSNLRALDACQQPRRLWWLPLFVMSLPQLELHDRPRPLDPPLVDRHLSESPVFVDDAGRRRRLVRMMARAVAAVGVLWLAAVASSLVGFRPLPVAVLDGDRPEPAAGVSERSSAAVGRGPQPDQDRSLAPLRSIAAAPSSDRAKRAPTGSRRPRTPPGIRTGRGAPAERTPDRASFPGSDAAPAPAPSSSLGAPGGVLPTASSPSSPAPPTTDEPAPTTPEHVPPPRTEPTTPPQQRDERAVGDPAFGAPALDRPEGAGRRAF